MMRWILSVWLALVLTWFLPRVVVPAAAKRRAKVQVWKKTFYSKRRFGRRKSSKRRGKWFRIARLRPRNPAMRKLLGKALPAFCKLSVNNQFTCEVRGTSEAVKGVAVVTASKSWPAGRVFVVIRIQSQGLSMEIDNKWKRRVRSKRKRRRRKRK